MGLNHLIVFIQQTLEFLLYAVITLGIRIKAMEKTDKTSCSQEVFILLRQIISGMEWNVRQ